MLSMRFPSACGQDCMLCGKKIKVMQAPSGTYYLGTGTNKNPKCRITGYTKSLANATDSLHAFAVMRVCYGGGFLVYK